MYKKAKPIIFILLLLNSLLLLSSWSWHYTGSEITRENTHLQYRTQQFQRPSTKTVSSLKKRNLPPDYGDRTQLSAFLLCVLLGFTGAHHFYMQNYKTAITQLCFFVVAFLLLFTNIAILLTLGVLLGTALIAWLIADLFILVYRGMRTKRKRKLIPW